MHQPILDFCYGLREAYPDFFKGQKVLEVGSHDINGSVRPLFTDCEYTGIDLGPGKGVDLVVHVCDFLPDKRKFDVVISTEAMEHDKRWSYSLLRMYGLLRQGGLLVLTFATLGREEHGTYSAHPECSPETLDHYENIGVLDFWRLFHQRDFKEHLQIVEDGDFRFCGVKA